RRLQRVPVAFEARRFGDPALEVLPHGHLPMAPASRAVSETLRLTGEEQGGADVDLGSPFTVRVDPELVCEAFLVDSRRDGGRDPRRPRKRLALVAEDELAALDPLPVLPLLLQRVLHLEEVREVAV